MAPANPRPGLESVALTLRNTSRWLATDFQVKSMIEGPLTGGCLCGAIRYETDRIFDVTCCHCNQCRRSSGAPVLLTAQIAGDAYRLTKGSPGEYRTSDTGRTFFCGTCGSGLYGEYAPPDHPLVREMAATSRCASELSTIRRGLGRRFINLSNASSRGAIRPTTCRAPGATLFRTRTNAPRAKSKEPHRGGGSDCAPPHKESRCRWSRIATASTAGRASGSTRALLSVTSAFSTVRS